MATENVDLPEVVEGSGAVEPDEMSAQRPDQDVEAAPAAPGEIAERLGAELARLRARSAVDPSVARRSLAPAWEGAAAGVEDDEAEFLDAMADCLGAGLTLDSALACWHTGDLAYSPGDDGDDESDDAGYNSDDEIAVAGPAAAVDASMSPHPPAHHAGGRRVFVR